MRQARRMGAVLTAGLLLLTACNGGDNEPDNDPPPIGGEENDDDSDENENEAPEDDEPYAVPDEIHEAYAEEVINVLLEIDVRPLKTVLEQDSGEVIDPEAVDRIHAVNAGARREQLMETYQLYINQPELTDGFLPVDEIDRSRFEAHGILHAEPDYCILVVGRWDLTDVAIDPPDEQQLFSLSRLDRDVTDIDRNPTPWNIREISPMQDAEGEPIPEDQWDDIQFGDALDHTCQDR